MHPIHADEVIEMLVRCGAEAILPQKVGQTILRCYWNDERRGWAVVVESPDQLTIQGWACSQLG